MESSIIAALITAIASIVVALIGKSAPGSKKQIHEALSFRYGGSKTWVVVIVALVLWILVSVVFISERLGVLNWFLIAIVTLLLSVVAPIRPMYAAAVVLILYSENFFMHDVHILLGGRYYRSPDYLAVLEGALAAGFAVALVVGLLCRWRGRIAHAAGVSVSEPEQDSPQISVLLGDELSKLARLHEAGALTDEEFQKAKNRVLGA